MEKRSATHYELLGVGRDAKAHEIDFAYQKWRALMGKEDVPPDPHRAMRIEQAYAVLSDPGQREAYDAALGAPAAVLARARLSLRARGGLVLAALAAIGAATWYAMRPPAQAASHGMKAQDLEYKLSRAVARVQAIGMDGVAKPVALAFAWGKGSLGSSCRAVPPAAELVLTFGARKVPAHVSAAQEGDGVCRLGADGAGSWPLDLDTDGPRPGERIYATRIDGRGDIVLVPATVRRIVPDASGATIETSRPLPADTAGGPLVNEQGRVVGIADAEGHHRVVPAAWISEWRGPPPEAKPAEPEPETTAPGDAVPGDAAPGEKPCPKDRGPSVYEMCEELKKASRTRSDL